MYRLLYSILYEIHYSALKPAGYLYGISETEFRELIMLVSQLGFISGEVITFTSYSLSGAALTERGKEFLIEHYYLTEEYPARSDLINWVKEESVYTRRI